MDEDAIKTIVGVRNPYAVAQLKLGQKIDWQKKTPEEKNQLLEKAFGKPYDQLFDPKFGSSLFPASVSAGSSEIQTGDPLSCTPNPCPAMSGFLQLPGVVFKNTARYDDSIQGCLPDCYFIAALCAYAWASNSSSSFQTKISSPNPYNYTFYSPAKDAAGNIIAGGVPTADPSFDVTDKIPLISPETIIYSRSNDYKEIWPSIYEKAFATWVYCKKNRITPGPTVNPDYLTICQGNPVTALINITGKPDTSFSTRNLADGISYEKIRTQFTAAGSDKTPYPTVAWTYPTAPAGVTYRDDVIVANHSYTVLGVYPKAPPADDKKYIVLRNTFGQSRGDPKTNLDPNLPSDAFYTGAWGPINPKLIGDATDGIFALRDSVFRKYFAGFGWVKF
jgi:hypothetical protein